VPRILFILMRHAPSFKEAVAGAVNGTKGNDTVAAIVGDSRRGAACPWGDREPVDQESFGPDNGPGRGKNLRVDR
jgi:hypothetical protein